jgi:hypothetical protein
LLKVELRRIEIQAETQRVLIALRDKFDRNHYGLAGLGRAANDTQSTTGLRRDALPIQRAER